jgi:hypothetical protein
VKTKQLAQHKLEFSLENQVYLAIENSQKQFQIHSFSSFMDYFCHKQFFHISFYQQIKIFFDLRTSQ